MKFNSPITLKEICQLVSCKYVGDPDHLIFGINEIHKVEKGDIVFVDHPKYYQKALKSLADIVIINQKVDCPEGKGLIISDKPFDTFNFILKHYKPFQAWKSLSGDKVDIDSSASIFPNVTIGNRVKIGKNTIVHAGVVLCDDTIIGDNVVIGPNSVIGFDAFYYKKKEDGYNRLHTCGRTIIHDNVEIGALSTIDRGVTGDTIIGKGTKLDNQVHVGHDTVIGENCLFAANVGIAGCVNIKNNVILWGQVGVISDVTIHENVVVLGQSGVGKSLEGNKTYFGSPCEEARVKFRELAAIRKIPSLLENL